MCRDRVPAKSILEENQIDPVMGPKGKKKLDPVVRASIARGKKWVTFLYLLFLF